MSWLSEWTEGDAVKLPFIIALIAFCIVAAMGEKFIDFVFWAWEKIGGHNIWGPEQ